MQKQTLYILAFLLVTLTVLPEPAFADFEESVGNALASFGAYVFGFVALLFKYAIEFLVFGIGGHMSGQLGFVVNTVWTIMRDLCNLVFIFLFLLIGIRLVLTIESTSGARKALVPLLLAALLVNFSLFFAKAIIDLANVAAVAVYGLFGTAGTVDVASAIAGALGLQSWFNVDAPALTEMTFSKGVMMMIFFLVAAIAFLTASIMLVKRYIVLLLGMIMSPLALIFRFVNVPFMSGIANKTKAGFSTFISSAFFPAVFLFIIYLTVQIVAAYGNPPQFSETLLKNNGSAMGTIIVYCIGIAMLFAAMKSASMISDSAANMAMSATRKAAGAATLGATAFAGRQTLGRAGRALQEGKVGEALRTGSINRSRLGRLVTTSALQGAEKMRTASYEARNTKAYQRAAAATGVPTGGGWGVRNQGFEAIREAEVKKEKETAERQAVILAGVNKAEQEEKEKKAAEEAVKARQELKDTQSYKKALENRYPAATRTADQQKEIDEANKAVDDAFKKDKEKKDEHKKVKNEYKEKVENVLVGTKEARQNIAYAEAAAKLPAAETARATLIAQRDATVTRMATVSAEERAVMQKKVDELDKSIKEQEEVIESANISAEKTVSTENKKRKDDVDAQIVATRTALAGVAPGTQEHAALTASLNRLRSDRVDYQRAMLAPQMEARAIKTGSAEHVAAAATYAPEMAQRNTDVAERLRDAAKAARNLKRKQGGIAGSLETETTVRDTARAAARGATLGRVDIGSSAGREAGAGLRDKNKPKP
ncbi:hypothetical protein A3C87_02770 [Candidatus Kaiserbacteria bacterium RIFCSPHIGHO2_02_FULL_49_34]|uniref:TrbL/VirB6 plasmid conjugal transfer protein n=1 Tax=Candidatus Kaiserbacteria bacterium RIFCSPHIGHO2_02_FULL_49_34 TaxID=1798491 RepID=A0A1F6DJF3_9BACT|nr:MAG: hypothetical protein A3C87_02770 [Candidatus Kaiserbacteria bacterium RIFCSPHIGHO2_02_FULL_49_34]